MRTLIWALVSLLTCSGHTGTDYEGPRWQAEVTEDACWVFLELPNRFREDPEDAAGIKFWILQPDSHILLPFRGRPDIRSNELAVRLEVLLPIQEQAQFATCTASIASPAGPIELPKDPDAYPEIPRFLESGAVAETLWTRARNGEALELTVTPSSGPSIERTLSGRMVREVAAMFDACVEFKAKSAGR